MNLFQRAGQLLQEAMPVRVTGRVARVTGLTIECEGLTLPIGSLCRIHPTGSPRPVDVEIVGFRERRALAMPFDPPQGLNRFDPVVSVSTAQMVPVGERLLGRIVDARGRPMDGRPAPPVGARQPLYASAPRPLDRARISEPLATGIRAIDSLLTCGKGQRIGIFSGSGVGKSTLLGMIARYTSADVNVIGLVGERGREVREFLEKDLGEEGLKRSVVVVATSDEPPLVRARAPFTTSAIAEYFRSRGADVMLLMDSITRTAFAYRELGLSIGEPPATKGYPPSVFSMMPRLLERSGTDRTGSITGMYTVLVEADDITDPIADTARSILDGHLWLARDLANRGQYPAVDPLTSISRLMIEVTDEKHQQAAACIRELLAVYRESEDLINIGAYVKGSNPQIDRAVEAMPRIREFLRQRIEEGAKYETTVQSLLELHQVCAQAGQPPPARKEEKQP